MKTAISIPDKLYRKAESVAHRLHKSRSALFSEAIKIYIESINPNEVTNRLNEVYGNIDEKIEKNVLNAQKRAIGTEKW